LGRIPERVTADIGCSRKQPNFVKERASHVFTATSFSVSVVFRIVFTWKNLEASKRLPISRTRLIAGKRFDVLNAGVKASVVTPCSEVVRRQNEKGWTADAKHEEVRGGGFKFSPHGQGDMAYKSQIA
jgi:hypothetical protein